MWADNLGHQRYVSATVSGAMKEEVHDGRGVPSDVIPYAPRCQRPDWPPADNRGRNQDGLGEGLTHVKTLP